MSTSFAVIVVTVGWKQKSVDGRSTPNEAGCAAARSYSYLVSIIKVQIYRFLHTLYGYLFGDHWLNVSFVIFSCHSAFIVSKETLVQEHVTVVCELVIFLTSSLVESSYAVKIRWLQELAMVYMGILAVLIITTPLLPEFSVTQCFEIVHFLAESSRPVVPGHPGCEQGAVQLHGAGQSAGGSRVRIVDNSFRWLQQITT